MRKTLKIALLAAIAASTGGALMSEPISARLGLLLRGNPIAATPASRELGQAAYVDYCAGCHGIRGDGNGELAADLGTRPANFGALNRPPAVLAMRIQFGVGSDMPAWRDSLDEETIWHIVNYLESLALNGSGRSQDRWWRPG